MRSSEQASRHRESARPHIPSRQTAPSMRSLRWRHRQGSVGTDRPVLLRAGRVPAWRAAFRRWPPRRSGIQPGTPIRSDRTAGEVGRYPGGAQPSLGGWSDQCTRIPAPPPTPQRQTGNCVHDEQHRGVRPRRAGGSAVSGHPPLIARWAAAARHAGRPGACGRRQAVSMAGSDRSWALLPAPAASCRPHRQPPPGRRSGEAPAWRAC